MSDDVGKLPRDYRRTLRIALVLLATFGPPAAYVHALSSKLESHITATEMQRRAFECAVAKNVYRLCMRAGEQCEPVPATCAEGR